MKRFHVHVSVPDLGASIRFYSTLFGAEPAVVRGDYAKWMLEDPRVNFAISQRGGKTGINHLGLQTDSDDELERLNAQLLQADLDTHAEKEVACCYARSNKHWVTDPTGIAWETFHTLGEVPTFDADVAAAPSAAAAPCCTPAKPAARSGGRLPVKPACCS
jgi:catechol 2,3-dioxygenase-like lactoylglutathione lyase family enzyme